MSKVYYNRDKTSRLVLQDGNFILLKDSLIVGVPQEGINWGEAYTKQINRINERQKELLFQNKVEIISEENGYVYYKSIVDIEAKSASNIADLCSGSPKNGYDFFIGLNEIRS